MKYDINQRNIMNKITEPVSKKRSSPGKNFSSSKKYEDSPDRLRDY
jgi:hypothetical protein